MLDIINRVAATYAAHPWAVTLVASILLCAVVEKLERRR
jgi:hypothetical protein